MEIAEEQIDEIIVKLSEAQEILAAVPVVPPDMEVTEWNATPVGRALARIQSAINMLVE